MMIQATVPSALGIIFTPWLLTPWLVLAAVVTMLFIVGLFVLLRRHKLTGSQLAWFGLLYPVFALGLLVTVISGSAR